MKYTLFLIAPGQFQIIEVGKTFTAENVERWQVVGHSDNFIEMSVFVKTYTIIRQRISQLPAVPAETVSDIQKLWESWISTPKVKVFSPGDF